MRLVKIGETWINPEHIVSAKDASATSAKTTITVHFVSGHVITFDKEREEVKAFLESLVGPDAAS